MPSGYRKDTGLPVALGHRHTEKTLAQLRSYTGKKHWKFKQEVTDQKGYVKVYCPDNLRADKRGKVKRADLVMERMLGRQLLSDEVVDHKNRIRDDDEPDNLRLFSTKYAHDLFHLEEYRSQGRTSRKGIPNK